MEEKKKKKGRPRKNFYFTQDTEDAIVRYNSTEDPELRDKIYKDEIHYAFNRLTEAITHRFKFYNVEVDYLEQLHHEVETFLHSKIHLYDQTRGSKAYSYFGTIAKRYLIIQNTKNYKKKIGTTSTDAVDNNDRFSYSLEDRPATDLEIYIDCFVEFCDENLFDIFVTEQDRKIADAILQIFRNRDKLDIINKKALYIYIKELVPEVSTPKITKISHRLKEIFKDNYSYFLEYGSVEFDY